MSVSTFRDLRIKGYMLLPAAYRSLSRLSSALSAKASTLRSYWLNHVYFYTANGSRNEFEIKYFLLKVSLKVFL